MKNKPFTRLPQGWSRSWQAIKDGAAQSRAAKAPPLRTLRAEAVKTIAEEIGIAVKTARAYLTTKKDNKISIRVKERLNELINS